MFTDVAVGHPLGDEAALAQLSHLEVDGLPIRAILAQANSDDEMLLNLCISRHLKLYV